MTFSEKIKIIDDKIEQNNTQYNLDTRAARSFALSTRNIGKYEFLKGGDVLPEKRLLEKAAIKRFECSPLGSELKKQTDNLGRQYQGLDEVYEFDKKEEK